MDLNTLYTQYTMVMAEHQDATLSQELSQLLITSHVLSHTMTEIQHTPSIRNVCVCVCGGRVCVCTGVQLIVVTCWWLTAWPHLSVKKTCLGNIGTANVKGHLRTMYIDFFFDMQTYILLLMLWGKIEERRTSKLSLFSAWGKMI